jgi:hypothetical protein
MRTSDLIGPALDWAVAKCEEALAPTGNLHLVGKQLFIAVGGDLGELGQWVMFSPSTDWSQGGPIIEREKITVRPVFRAERAEGGSDVYRQEGWAAHIEPRAFWITPRPFAGPTPLIAAMRCFAALKLGDEVEIPEELL